MRAKETVDQMLRRLARKILPRETRIGLRKVYYFGTKFNCTLCGSSVRTLLDSGYDLPILRDLEVIGGFRRKDSCPVCQMGSRTRLVGCYLERELLRKGDEIRRILHVAPEIVLSSIIKRQLANIDYVAADLNPEHYDASLKLVRADITNLPWDENRFDLVICNHVLEHIPDDRKAISELYRVTKRRGLAIVQVPIGGKLSTTIEDPAIQCPIEQERRFGQRDHVRIYGADYCGRLRAAGFEVEIFNPVTAWGPNVVERLHLDPDERMFLARK
jgi:SAM-dependent methyltransferase